MADLLEVFPRKVVALVAAPLLLGLLLFVLLFDLGPTAWTVVLLVVIGGVAFLVFVGARTVLLERQRGPVDDPEGE